MKIPFTIVILALTLSHPVPGQPRNSDATEISDIEVAALKYMKPILRKRTGQVVLRSDASRRSDQSSLMALGAGVTVASEFYDIQCVANAWCDKVSNGMVVVVAGQPSVVNGTARLRITLSEGVAGSRPGYTTYALILEKKGKTRMTFALKRSSVLSLP